MKFKVYDKLTDEYVRLHSIQYNDKCNIVWIEIVDKNNTIKRLYSKEFYGMNEDEFILYEYIGIQDKNGIEIYEDDLVKTKYGRICKAVKFKSPSYIGFDLCPMEDTNKCPDEYDLYEIQNLEVLK